MNKFKWIYLLLKFTGVLWLFNRKMLQNEQRLVLCYHRISETTFDQHINFLKQLFDIVPLKSLLADTFNTNHTTRLHSTKPLLAITMDDCYGKEFHRAYTVCQKHEVHCTYFVPTNYAEKQVSLWSLRLIDLLKRLEIPCTITDFESVQVTFNQDIDKTNFELKWVQTFLDNPTQTNDIEELFNQFFLINKLEDYADAVIGKDVIQAKSNNKFTSFQSHTVSHPKLYLCSEKQLEHEFETSKSYLSSHSAHEEQYVICYPYGSSTHIGNSYTKASNYYEYGVTLQSGVVTKQSEKMLIPRIGIYEHDTYQSIRVKIFFAQLRAIV